MTPAVRFFFIIFALALFLSTAEPGSAFANEKVIAFAQDTMANDYRKAQVFEVRDALAQNQAEAEAEAAQTADNYSDYNADAKHSAEHSRLRFTSSNANGQTSLLIHQIEKFIAAQVDVLIVGTNDPEAVVPVITKAHQLSIPIIILDRGINSTAYTTFINSDNIKIGKIGAQYITEQLKDKGTVLLFEGLQKADVTQLRNKGFLDVMSHHEGIKVIRRTGNYLRKDAIIEMEKLIEEGIHIDAIFSESDSMLSGVRSALHRHELDPKKILMIGCDYTSEAREAIRKGTQTGSILFPLGGHQTVQIALKILKGEKVSKHISLPIKLVTRKNVNEVPPAF